MQPHEMTQAEFVSTATVEALVNHGRKWNVTLGRNSAFSDEATPAEALVDVHHAFVNNALCLNAPDAPDIGEKPSMPPREVLADYPDLVRLYGVQLDAC